jgi:hypothetical protein
MSKKWIIFLRVLCVFLSFASAYLCERIISHSEMNYNIYYLQQEGFDIYQNEQNLIQNPYIQEDRHVEERISKLGEDWIAIKKSEESNVNEKLKMRLVERVNGWWTFTFVILLLCLWYNLLRVGLLSEPWEEFKK